MASSPPKDQQNHVDRTHDWVLELHSLDDFEEPTSPATPTSDDIHLPRWSSEITPGEASPRTRRPPPWGSASSPGSRGRPRNPSASVSEPLPGAADCLEFVKTSPRARCFSLATPQPRFRPARQTRLRNSLLAAVGFLELANAGDFAANVFNQTPVPLHAEVLMAIGGTVAFGMIYFGVADGRLSWQNLRALREERRYLRSQRAAYAAAATADGGDDRVTTTNYTNMLRTIDCFLDMNTREMGTEMIDRLGMDVLLGVSAFFVSLGTFMAMDGGHVHGLFVTSNLLTGYVGNAPCLIFGITNAAWSSYVWARARKQQAAALRYVGGSTRISQMLRNRTSSIQVHASLTGLTCFVSGIAAMITATMWWGYVVLFPCVITSGLANLFWRRRVGYERPLVAHRVASIDQDIVVEALRYADAARRRVLYGRRANGQDAFTTLVAERDSLLCALDVVRKNNLFEDFCVRLLDDAALARRVRAAQPSQQQQAHDDDNSPTIDWHQLVASDDQELVQRLLEVARRVINERALQSFVYQERHLLELLGCYMCRGAQFGRQAKAANKNQRHKPSASNGTTIPAQNHLNVHTYAGRHANDWLFGGFSVTQSLKAVFRRG